MNNKKRFLNKFHGFNLLFMAKIHRMLSVLDVFLNVYLLFVIECLFIVNCFRVIQLDLFFILGV